MTYTAISDFKYGMDRRRPQSSGVPGTLWTLKNALITRGGDIERAKKFVSTFVLPAGTFGAFSIRGQVFVFGSGAEPAGMPVGVRYQRLQAPGDPAMTAVLDAKAFDGKVYAVAAYADGNIYHFYDGARVTEWDALADNAADFTTVSSRLADLIDAGNNYDARAFGPVVEVVAVTPGVPFTISATATDVSPPTSPTAVVSTVQPNIPEVQEVRAIGSVTITGGLHSPGLNRVTSVTVGATELIGQPIDWIEDNEATANTLAVEINNNTSTHGYSASAAGATITLRAAPNTGASQNGLVVDTITTGSVTASTTNMAGGVNYVAPVAQVSTVTIGGTGAVPETKATGTLTITGGTSSPGVNKINTIVINGADLIDVSIDWTGSNSTTAAKVADAINSGTHGFTAVAASNVVTITAPENSGATINGEAVTVTTGGDVTTTTAAMSGGVSAVTYAQDTWTVTVDGEQYRTTGRGSAMGTSILVHNFRVYSTAGPLVRYSAINAPTDWSNMNVSSGAGFINMSNQADAVGNLIGMSKYAANVAIFSRNVILIYSLEADAMQSEIVQVIDNTGTIAPRSIVDYGANDVFYLDETGVRSLRTREAYDAAYASDIGSAFDSFIQELIAEVGNKLTSQACALIESRDGRYMLAIGRYIVALSQFPASKISAWSYIDFEQTITDFVRVDRSVMLRAGDAIYIYGGRAGNIYPEDDEFVVEAITPFISSKDPAGLKELEGFDMAAENSWRVQILPDPNNPAHYIDVGTYEGTTYHLTANKTPGLTSHFALKFVCDRAGPATLSSTAVHYEPGEKA